MIPIEKEIEAWARKNLPVYEFMDLKVINSSDGLYRCLVPLSKNTTNHIFTVHAAFQWAAAEILGGLVVLCNRKDEKYVPVVKGLNIDFKAPALSDITSTAYFADRDVVEMNSALESTGRYDFALNSKIRDTNEQVVAEAEGYYAVRVFKE